MERPRNPYFSVSAISLHGKEGQTVGDVMNSLNFEILTNRAKSPADLINVLQDFDPEVPLLLCKLTDEQYVESGGTFHWVGCIEIRDGENKYTNVYLVVAPNQEMADIAFTLWFGQRTSPGDYRLFEVLWVNPISEEGFNTFRNTGMSVADAGEIVKWYICRECNYYINPDAFPDPGPIVCSHCDTQYEKENNNGNVPSSKRSANQS